MLSLPPPRRDRCAPSRSPATTRAGASSSAARASGRAEPRKVAGRVVSVPSARPGRGEIERREHTASVWVDLGDADVGERFAVTTSTGTAVSRAEPSGMRAPVTTHLLDVHDSRLAFCATVAAAGPIAPATSAALVRLGRIPLRCMAVTLGQWCGACHEHTCTAARRRDGLRPRRNLPSCGVSGARHVRPEPSTQGGDMSKSPGHREPPEHKVLEKAAARAHPSQRRRQAARRLDGRHQSRGRPAPERPSWPRSDVSVDRLERARRRRPSVRSGCALLPRRRTTRRSRTRSGLTKSRTTGTATSRAGSRSTTTRFARSRRAGQVVSGLTRCREGGYQPRGAGGYKRPLMESRDPAPAAVRAERPRTTSKPAPRAVCRHGPRVPHAVDARATPRSRRRFSGECTSS